MQPVPTQPLAITLLALALASTCPLHAQKKATTTPTPATAAPAATPTAAATDAAAPPAPAAPPDPTLDYATNLSDHMLFPRCSCAEGTLSFDAQGHPAGNPKMVDWTLTGVRFTQAERKSPTEIELDGFRVIMGYNQNVSEFQQHPRKDEKVKVMLADPGNVAALSSEVDAVFSFGIDPSLQHAMPLYWRHYFDPGLGWGKDGLENAGKTTSKDPIIPPAVTNKAIAGYTEEARRDKVQGTVTLHFLVDETGAPRRIALKAPLGYGLDERAATATAKLHFTPAMQSGKPIASPVTLSQDFILAQIQTETVSPPPVH